MILIVANSITPFAFECVQILGLPDGSYFKGRFPDRWIEPKLLKTTKNLEGAEAVIALRLWDSDRILPLRRIRIISVKKAGDILFLTYELGRIFSYSSVDKERHEQIDFFDRAVKKKLDKITNGHSSPKKEMYPLIFEIEKQELLGNFYVANNTSPDPETNWMTLIGLLGKNPIFHGIPFFRIKISKDGSPISCKLCDGALIIKSDCVYQLDILYLLCEQSGAALSNKGSRSPKTPYMISGPYEFTMNSDKNDVEFNPKVHPLSGRYDSFRVAFEARQKGSFRDVLRFAFTVPDKVLSAYRPVFDIPARFNKSWSGLFIRAGAIVFLTVLWFLLNYQDDLREFLNPKFANFAGQFSLVFFTITCIEFVKYALGLWVPK